MKRVKDLNSIVHFIGKNNRIALCGAVQATDLLGQVEPMPETTDRVTCPHCARLYCQIKNAPWNEVDDVTMDKAIYAAVDDSDVS